MFNHKGIKIEVASTGWFTATMDDVKIEAKSLEEAKTKIDRELTAKATASREALKLNVLVIASGVDTFKKPRILEACVTGINRTSGQLMITGIPGGLTPDHAAYSQPAMCPNTQPNRAIMERWLMAREEFNTASALLNNAVLARGPGGRIDAGAYASLIAKLQADYDKKASIKEAKSA